LTLSPCLVEFIIRVGYALVGNGHMNTLTDL